MDKYGHLTLTNYEVNTVINRFRQHSNFLERMVLWGDQALATDHIGFSSKNVLLNKAPTAGHFHEQYPHQAGAWVHDK